MRDMTGAPIEIGDYLLDERGRVYEVRFTEPTIQAQHIIYVYNTTVRRGKPYRGEEGFLREGAVCKVEPELLTTISRQGFMQLWRDTFLRYRAPQIDAEIAAHRASTNARRQQRGIVFP